MPQNVQNVYEHLREEIVSGKIDPGTSLVETSIAARFEISRTPAREALRQLEQDGLLERQHRGLVVRRRSPEEILEIYGVRVVLEGLAARTAAESRTEFDIANLVSRHTQMLELSEDDVDFRATTNRQFHEALWLSSHNRVLVEMLVRLNSLLTRYPATTLASPGRWETILEDHQRLIDAIVARKANLAASIAEAHMAAAREIRLRLYASENRQVIS